MAVAPKTLSAVTVATTAGGTVLSATSILCSYVRIEADAANTAATNIYVGDSNISSSRYSAALQVANAAGNAARYVEWYAPAEGTRPGATNIDLSKIYAICGTGSQKLQVTYIERMS